MYVNQSSCDVLYKVPHIYMRNSAVNSIELVDLKYSIETKEITHFHSCYHDS